MPGWVVSLGAVAVIVPFAVLRVPGQETPPAGQTQSSSSSHSSSSSNKQKHSHANDFLIRGTVFSPDARSFAGAQLRIRRAGERKFRWEDRTNTRGEFAIRVPQGAQYEVVAQAKGFTNQSKTIDAKSGPGDNNVVFRMEAVAGGKK
jgi:hypothetical protein